MTSLTDVQISGLLDIIIAQAKDLYTLKSLVFALSKIANEMTSGAAEELVAQYMKQFEQTTPAQLPYIEQLESMSLQLKQSGKPIQ